MRDDRPQKRDREFTVRYNDGIRTRNVLLVEEGQKPRIMANDAAKRLAAQRSLDLVEIGFQKMSGEPVSVVKIMGHSKYVYEKKQAEKEAKRKARESRIDVKNVQFRLTSDVGDVDRKCRQIEGFLEEGNHVRVELFLRGREENMKDLIRTKFSDILARFRGKALFDENPRKEGRTYATTLRPVKKAG